MDEVLNIEQVAALLSCDATTVAEHLRRGLLPGLKFGRHWVVPARAFFERVNALAHEQAAARRDESKRARTPLAYQVQPVTGGKRGRVRPVLPSLTDTVYSPASP
ncbi:MAG: helix-turn-helix domain-containing protein [Acidovorax soli]|uniref:helix-turn-helix domain-containing protein n=1 Tax=Acidovorax soli TaxID=592050 RepID=UPI0026EBB2FC|nr:helix-turn-helix domain-containing protein [Acidovorax soli]MCM2348126.1 helix-turn-helix domain-containing protein [Acidovorax soli]